jgi:magnesium chelatase family protein
LALDGALRPIKGALAISYGISQSKRQLILPAQSAEEAALVENIHIRAASSLQEVVTHFTTSQELPIITIANIAERINHLDNNKNGFQQVKGQLSTKKALEIAAAGRHSVLMIGNPGCGKSMLASRITSILPQLTTEQAITSASIQSLSNQGFQLQNWGKVPFRSPHHSTSGVALVGGGSNPKPGEISLAHNGVLFLDELPEFDRKVLEVLREPLEAKKINIARANHRVEYLADFQLIAAMNPCPCGYADHPQQSCTCSVEQINRYRAKISGPLLDRIDIVVDVPSLNTNELQQLPNGEGSEQIKERVIDARKIQLQRQGKLNYELSNDEIDLYCALDNKAKALMQQIIDRNSLSARGYYRQLKLARTIADLASNSEISSSHLALASQYKRNI